MAARCSGFAAQRSTGRTVAVWRICRQSGLAARYFYESFTDKDELIRAAAHFVVGGVAQTISAWLAGEVRLDPDQLIDQLTSLLDEFGDPNLYRD